MFTDELITELINCPKTITVGPKAVSNRGAFSKREFKMESVNGIYKFKGFFNQNETFQEDFSLGLVYYHKDDGGRYCLLRCNGIHGGNKHIPHHNVTHEHTPSAEDLNIGIKDEKNVKEISDYTTFDQAIQYFVRRVNIIEGDRDKHFPKPKILLPSLFGGFV